VNDQDRRIKPKLGDTIIWHDGTVGMLVERFDLYKKGRVASRRDYFPCWCWHIAFPTDSPRDYNVDYGESEVNIMNRNKVKTIIPC
jgi:hypothetical protein